MKELFDSNFASEDKELKHLLANTSRGQVIRNFIEDMWRDYYPRVRTEERAFRGDLKEQPHARLWEMYLAVALEKCGFDLADKTRKGPDIQICDPTVWVEAVGSTDGDKGNKSAQPVSGIPEILPSGSMWGGPPEDQIILRCLASIKEKKNKLCGYDDRKGKHHQGYIEKGIVNDTDPYVIALNTYKTSFAQFDHQHTPNHLPMIVKTVFGYGETVLLQLYPTDGLSAPISSDRFDYIYRPHVKGTEVLTDIFFQEEYSEISALIVSKVGFWTWHHGIPSSLSENFILVHNPLARNRLPNGWLKSGHEIWIEQGQLHKRIWENGNEGRLETFPLPTLARVREDGRPDYHRVSSVNDLR